MRLFPIGIEHADIIPMQRSHDTDPGEPATRDEYQVVHRILPLGWGMLSFRKLGDVVGGILDGDEAGRINRVAEGASSLPQSDARYSGDRAGASTSGLFLSRQSIRNPAV
jgi:hypothetical protein